MNDKGFRLYGYRWMVLGVFMFINLTIRMLWIAYAPITGPAAQFYGVSDLQIGPAGDAVMITFIPLSRCRPRECRLTASLADSQSQIPAKLPPQKKYRFILV